MICPACNSKWNHVVNSRKTLSGFKIWRRRKCLKCENRFTTYEQADLSFLTVKKRSGKSQKYNRVKLYSGIYFAAIQAKNIDRGEMAILSEKLTNEVEERVLKLNKKIINSKEIIKIVLEVLKEKDKKIYLRYLSFSDHTMQFARLKEI